MNRSSAIETIEMNMGDEIGIIQMFTVHMYEDDKLVESRTLPNYNIHYAEDVAENWENGIIKKGKK